MDPNTSPAEGSQEPVAAPEQEVAEVAQQHEDAQQDESAPEGEKLSEEQKTIRKLQRRIDRITAQKGAASREAELLREQLAQKVVPQEEKPDLSRQDIERLATEKAQEIAHQTDIAKRVNTVLTAGKKLDGFDAAVNAVADEVPFTDRKGKPTPFIEAVLDADDPAALLHYLGNNPEDASEFAGLSPAQIGRRLARLEDKLKRDAKASAAPSPLKSVQAKSTTERVSSSAEDELAAIRKARWG